MSHNPWALLGDEADEDAGGSGDEAMRDGAPSAPPPPPPQALRSSTPEPPAAGAALSRKQQRQMSKRAQRIAKATASVAASAPSASSADAVDVASEDDDGEDDDDEDEEEGADDAPMAGAGATAPAEVGLSAAELATTTRVLGLLQTHHGLLEHAALKAVRSSLAPLVERLAAQWKLGRVQSATQRLKALKRSHKNMLSSDSAAAREYAAALDSAARNATGMRAQRLSKLEALNTLKDGEAEDEEVVARRALLASMRVPDGVAITDGSSQDVCMKLLTDESAGKANGGGGKRQKLLTGASSGGPAVVDGAAPTAAASVAASPAATGPLPSATLHTPIKCYTCKTPFRELHHFYDSLCPTCAKLNFSKRSLSADLSGKIVLVTGARVKIGYRILVKLLRCGAFVVATTRFPHDLSKRLLLEHDHSAWSARVHVVGIDFRNLQVLEDFVKLMYAKYSHLDAIINNACQTVRRPPAFYQHLIDAERVAYDDLKPEAQNMLRLHHGFALGHSSGLLQAGGGDMRRLQSGSGVDIDLPSMDGTSSSNGAASTSQHSQQPKAASSVQFTRSAPSGITIEEYAGEDDDAAAEEIVAGISGNAGKKSEQPPSPRNPTASSGSPASSAAASAAAAASSTAAASASASKQPGNQAPKGKKSRRAAMREAATAPPADAAAASSTSQALSLGADTFVSPTALAAESTQLAVLASDNMSAEERARLFPSGARDINGQQVDLRAKNSWTMRLADVPIGEAAEVMAINYLAPMLLNSQLKALMIRGNEDKKQARFIINVSAMEGKFYRYKSANHPHTNAAKAALNMMTRTSAQDYVDANIFMTAVDTGWINDENPLPTAAKIASQHNFQTPLDEVDAAMRVLDPMLAPLATLQANPALSVKEAKIPYGVFLKDYAKCEW